MSPRVLCFFRLRSGPLALKLRREYPDIDFRFMTLSTTWQTSCCIEYFDYDVVVHLGLGVYHCCDTLLVEDGAINLRSRDVQGSEGQGPGAVFVGAKDAAGIPAPAKKLRAEEAECLRDDRISAVIQGIHDTKLSGGSFRVLREVARPQNSYM